ncbi:biotin--[acetyl-CoA-carboxylase] ligase [candidate division WWE3 bacterium CG_4_8_14_3_um_filter_42_11]|uniref:Biotin--[acetyl-CoA-carboxylase] ligase n=2 Tax=Bacteria candidate phyla TaxID=1783234 RepID=A0A2H0MPV9_9BACT|nr:MAG: biotin--[acetyl-CoA-carboxylase] ligase [Candidatus Nealsonbacteria bacterium CG11_big_fil_rev_8_21_14_0_20_39_9]PJC68305.1 MAG: biotin--[acetyl-CoA-carboxylase] ligase [candidate division WWE3 bacterium CG_4_8_14_3_um_filter_42_11]
MQIQKFKTLNSTNQKAKELARKGAEPWTIILTEEQSAGYGKEKVPWFSPKGGLYFSIILPKSTIEDLQTLTVLAAFIVAKVIKENFSLEPLIKLPNDVRLKEKKVAGILTENIIGKEVKVSIIGIGLNTNIDRLPRDLEDIATSLKIELGKKVDNKKILKEIVLGIKEQLKTISQ